MGKGKFRTLNHFIGFFSAKRKAVSPLVAFVLTIALVTAATTIALTVVKPTFDRISDSIIIDEGMQNLELINSAVKQVASESQGSKRTLSLSVTEGDYGMDASKDFVYFNYSTKTDFSIQGTIKNVRLDKSPVFIEYFNHYSENSNASPPWNIKNGTWQINSGEYSGQNGLAYYNFGNITFFAIEGRITNKSGIKGEIFALPVTPNDLRLYTTFDEGSGNYSYDYSGFNNTGTLINMSISGNATSGWSSAGCKFDSCLLFDGVDDYVNAGLTAYNFTDITITAWIYARNRSNSETWPGIVTTGGASTPVFEIETTTYTSSTFKVHFSMFNGTGGWLYSPDIVTPLNTWVFVAGTWNGTHLSIYVDNTVARTAHVATPRNATGSVTIGAFTPSLYRFNGTIDEVKIYNRSLTAGEVRSEYELGINKLSSTGRTNEISQKTDLYLVLSNPSGTTNFDEVKIKTKKRAMQLSVPYTNVDLNGTARFPKGNYQLSIQHMGVNTTVNKPIVQLSLA